MSFTHLIGYAAGQGAGRDAGDEQRLTPRSTASRRWSSPAHVNLGLAIDLAKPDGTRSAARARTSSAPRRWTSPQFWTAYEDIVRRARANKLTVDDFAGTTISLTNPGTIGTVHSVPRLMPGQGAIIGVGAMEYPAEWQGASQETLNRNAVSQDHHADLDLRPPDHPGRAVRRVPAGRAPAAARRGRLLRRDLRVAAHPLRAGPLGAATSRPTTTTTSTRRPGCRS